MKETSLNGKRVCFIGRLSGMSRKEATGFVRTRGGQVVAIADGTVNIIVIGEKERPDFSAGESPETRPAFERGELEVLPESDFWRRYADSESDHSISDLISEKQDDIDSADLPEMPNADSSTPLYTPAMLAELTSLPAATIRFWYQQGLINAVRQIGRLPYFSALEIPVVRRLAGFVAGGLTAEYIANRINRLRSRCQDIKRLLDCLTLSENGGRLLFKHNGMLVDPRGQRYFDFDTRQERCIVPEDGTDVAILSAEKERFSAQVETVPYIYPGMGGNNNGFYLTESEKKAFDRQMGRQVVALCEAAWQRSEAGALTDAIELYRAALVAGGTDVGICFQLAELLEREGELTAARERYYMVLELDEDYLEARANLGRVLARLGLRDEAVAALHGALEYHPNYPEAHLELGTLYFEMNRYTEAEDHLRYYLSTVPDSPRTDAIEIMLETITGSKRKTV